MNSKYDMEKILELYPFPEAIQTKQLDAILEEFHEFNRIILSSKSYAKKTKSSLLLSISDNSANLRSDRNKLKEAFVSPRSPNSNSKPKGFSNRYVTLQESDMVDVQSDSLFEINQKTGLFVHEVSFRLSSQDQMCVQLHFKLSDSGYFPSMHVEYISDAIGYGVFASNLIPKNTFLGIYSGSVHSSEHCLYWFHDDNFDLTYKHKCRNSATVKAHFVGNIGRFINCASDEQIPNVRSQRNSNFDLNQPTHMAILLISTREIKKGEQLLYRYNSFFVRFMFEYINLHLITLFFQIYFFFSYVLRHPQYHFFFD